MDNFNPAQLEGEAFHGWISQNLDYRVDWSKILVSEHINRTMYSLEGLLLNLKTAIEESDDGDSERVRRLEIKKSKVEVRLRQVERHLHGTGGARQMSEWKAFAHSLCEIIEDSDLVAELDVEMAPFGLTAREWLTRRRVKRGDVAA